MLAIVFNDYILESRPAPNQYIPILPLSEKMVTLKGVHQEFKPLKTPSPANYIISNVAFTGPQYSLTPKVIPYKEDLLEPSPGPNDYNPKIELMHEAQPSFSFGKKTKILSQLPNAVPGPGTYLPFDRQIKGNDAPKATLKGRRSTKIGEHSPI